MVSFSGIGSGLDLTALIDSTVQLERLPINQLEGRKADANQAISTIGSLVTRLQALQSEAEGLSNRDDVRALSTVSDNEDLVSATASDAAAIGSYNLRVDRLATSQVSVSSGFAQNTVGIAGTGSLGIQVGDRDRVDIVFDGNMNLDDIADQINQSEAQVTAAVVNDGTSFRLMISGNEVGSTNAITFTENSVTFGLNEPVNQLNAAQDAQFQLNGLPITRPTNTISDLLPGITFELNQEMDASDADVNIRVDNDPAALKDKLQGFVDAYNQVVGAISFELSSGSVEGAARALAGDSTLQGLQRRLSQIVFSAYPGSGGQLSLGALGIDLQNDGGLSINDANFDAAYNADPTQLQDLFAGDGTTSLTALVDNLVDEYTVSGTGILATKRSGFESRIDEWDRQIEQVEERAERLEVRLRRTYAALDTRISDLNTQGGFISQAFLNNNNNNG